MVRTLCSNIRLSFARVALLVPLITGAAINACSAVPAEPPPGSGGEGAASGSGDADLDAGNGDGPKGDACAIVTAEATLSKRPLDIVMLIDNSGSMWDDIDAVQKNINDNFAGILAAAGVDYRVIVLSLHGWSDTAMAICIEAPLSAASCDPAPDKPAINPPYFITIRSRLAAQTPGAGSSRATTAPSSTTSSSGRRAGRRGCATAPSRSSSRSATIASFVAHTTITATYPAVTPPPSPLTPIFRALSPLSFGDAAQRNYVWHSIVGMEANMPPSSPWLPGDPNSLQLCDTASSSGNGYQSLSILTGGLRFPLCEHASYNAVFQAIAESALSKGGIDCSFPVPEVPDGQQVDLEVVSVEYTPGDGGAEQTFKLVDDFASCGPSSFYVDKGIIKLCPAACGVVQADIAAKIAVSFDCVDTPI